MQQHKSEILIRTKPTWRCDAVEINKLAEDKMFFVFLGAAAKLLEASRELIFNSLRTVVITEDNSKLITSD